MSRSPQRAKTQLKQSPQKNQLVDRLGPGSYNLQQSKSVEINSSPKPHMHIKTVDIGAKARSPSPIEYCKNYSKVEGDAKQARMCNIARKSYFADITKGVNETGPGAYNINKKVQKQEGITFTHKLPQGTVYDTFRIEGADQYYNVEKLDEYNTTKRIVSLEASTRFKDQGVFE